MQYTTLLINSKYIRNNICQIEIHYYEHKDNDKDIYI